MTKRYSNSTLQTVHLIKLIIQSKAKSLFDDIKRKKTKKTTLTKTMVFLMRHSKLVVVGLKDLSPEQIFIALL
jgi:hypothetical protein